MVITSDRPPSIDLTPRPEILAAMLAPKEPQGKKTVTG
jgi:hypothetical protein